MMKKTHTTKTTHHHHHRSNYNLYAHRKLRCHAQTHGQNCNHRFILSHPKLR